MCKKCKGKDKKFKCPCRGKITTSDGNKAKYNPKNGKVMNQKGAFGSNGREYY